LPPKLAAKLGINAKRAEYILIKWSRNDLWESGVSLRSGWFTPKAYAIDEFGSEPIAEAAAPETDLRRRHPEKDVQDDCTP